MVVESRGRLFMVTDEPRNDVVVYDRSGRLLENLYVCQWNVDRTYPIKLHREV